MWSNSQRHCLTLMGIDLLGELPKNEAESTVSGGVVLVYEGDALNQNSAPLSDIVLYTGQPVARIKQKQFLADNHSKRLSIVLADQGKVKDKLKQQGYQSVFVLEELTQPEHKRRLWEILQQKGFK